MIEIDGAQGEGGGQILRSALALSLVTGHPFRMSRIRAGRRKPGLLRQHLTAVNAAVEVGSAKVRGAEMGSGELQFEPGEIRGGEYHFAVGTAGSATLVLQTVLPALARASAASSVLLEGGTHNPYAPPYDFLERTFAPVFNRLGPSLSLSLERSGFYPAGGGRFAAAIQPAATWRPFELLERGEAKGRAGRIRTSHLPESIGERQARMLRSKLNWDKGEVQAEKVRNSPGPGNIALVELAFEQVTETFCSFGERHVPSVKVIQDLVQAVRRYQVEDVPVGVYLADQLLLPLALAGGGSFRTLPLSRHATTNMDVIRLFGMADFEVENEERNVRVRILPGSSD